MDNQKCAIRMLSCQSYISSVFKNIHNSPDAYVANRVNITWFSRSPTRYNREIELPEYRIVSINGEYCDGTYSYAIMEHSELRGYFAKTYSY